MPLTYIQNNFLRNVFQFKVSFHLCLTYSLIHTLFLILIIFVFLDFLLGHSLGHYSLLMLRHLLFLKIYHTELFYIPRLPVVSLCFVLFNCELFSGNLICGKSLRTELQVYSTEIGSLLLPVSRQAPQTHSPFNKFSSLGFFLDHSGNELRLYTWHGHLMKLRISSIHTLGFLAYFYCRLVSHYL